MRDFVVEHMLGAHCTGIHAVTGLSDAGGLGRTTAMVGAVGSTFTLAGGIRPGTLNRYRRQSVFRKSQPYQASDFRSHRNTFSSSR